VRALHRLFRFVTCLLSVIGVARASHATDAWLSLEVSPGCAPVPAALAERIRARAAGNPDDRLSLRVLLRDRRQGSVARVELLADGRSRGLKELMAPSCPELLEAVTAVAALALTSLPLRAPEREAAASLDVAAAPAMTAPLDAPASERTAPSLHPPALPVADTTAGEREPSRSRGRVLVGMGVDVGTLERAAPVLSGGAALRAGTGELRALILYGVPSIEELETDGFERTYSDFAAAELDYCLGGVLTPSWLALCGGLRGSFARVSRISAELGAPRVERQRVDPLLSAVAGATVAYRAGLVQPELEVVAQLPVTGTSAGGRDPGIRTTISASLSF
jgi:hypothetical protein